MNKIISIPTSKFGSLKDKLSLTENIKELKAFVSTAVDIEVLEQLSWKSPSGGIWKFTNEQLLFT